MLVGNRKTRRATNVPLCDLVLTGSVGITRLVGGGGGYQTDPGQRLMCASWHQHGNKVSNKVIMKRDP